MTRRSELGMIETSTSAQQDSAVDVAWFLQCESSEDGDGATGRISGSNGSGILPVPLQYAVLGVGLGQSLKVVIGGWHG